VNPNAVVGDPRDEVKDYVRTREWTPNTMLALRNLINDIGTETANFKELAKVPEGQVRNFRNDMYLTSESLRLMKKSNAGNISAADWTILNNYKRHIDHATKFIPTWVKVGRRPGAGTGNDGGLEAHCRHRGREDWQGPPDLRAGGGGGNHRHGNDSCRRLHGTAGKHHSRVIVGRGRDHVGQQVGLADEHDSQPSDGLGADATSVDWPVGVAILVV